MRTDVPLHCRCGRVRGAAVDVGASMGTRLLCYCDDCQAYARFLGEEGILDECGGTDIFQTTPAHVRITEGVDAIRCLRLSEKGLFRWYAGCCNTPIGNTLSSAKVPFVGIVHSFMDHASDGRTRDEALGKPVAYTQGKFAIGGVPAHAHASAPLSVILRAIRVLFLGWVRREHRPSPFFDPDRHRPIVEPRILTKDERRTASSAPTCAEQKP